jgi:hypothetical protein
MADSIPHEAFEHIRGFLEAKKTGNIQLDIKEGAVLSWRVTEFGRLPPKVKPPYNGISRY